MRRLLVAVTVFVVSVGMSGCAGSSQNPGASPTESPMQVLFVGNSYTYVNDLPGTFASLARSKGRNVEVATLASGGATLDQHLADPATSATLDKTRWDYVVLQEQSEIPSVTSAAEYSMYPPARSLVDQIRQRDEKPLFFVTWGHRDGDASFGIPDYETMQRAIDGSYIRIAQELDVPLVPVGVAWFTVARQDKDVELWQSDGSHPSSAGTYLAACVFYAAIFRESPEGASYDGGVGTVAGVLQRAAAGTVLENPAQWGLR